jgi:L-fuconolactonase
MRIDAHQHFWQFDPSTHAWISDDMQVIQRDFLPPDLLPILLANQFDGCIAVQADQSLKETNWLLSLATQHSFIKGVIGWVDFRSPDIQDQLASFSIFPVLKGFRHIVQSEAPGFLLDHDFNCGISLLKDYAFVYEILVFEHQLEEVIAFVRQHPYQVFILDHMGKPNLKVPGGSTLWATHIEVLAGFPNVHCKLSGLITEAVWNAWTPDQFTPYLNWIGKVFGPERILFGSDWPVCLLAGSYTDVLQIIQDWIDSSPNPHALEACWGLNAQKLYRI